MHHAGCGDGTGHTLEICQRYHGPKQRSARYCLHLFGCEGPKNVGGDGNESSGKSERLVDDAGDGNGRRKGVEDGIDTFLDLQESSRRQGG